MIVHLSPDAPARLGDLERLDRLHAECIGPVASAQLADWCSIDDDGEHAWLDVAACRELGRSSLGDDWVGQFNAMIAYAASNGWTDVSGDRVRAHVERTDQTEGS